jgi:ligand-binding SRPBCC domain-containing protein
MAANDDPAPSIEVGHEGGIVRVRATSTVAAPVEEVWAVATTFAGVNAELMPYCRMREPRALRGRTLESYQPGERAACWLLAGGVVPFDRHLLGLASIAPGEGFVEESTTWLQRRWRHERTLAPVPGGRARTTVIDQLTVEPRLRFAAPLTARTLGVVFRHRHRRLHARFGA